MEMKMTDRTLYERLGGYEGIVRFTSDLLPRLQADTQLGRFWKNRGDDGIKREHQLLNDYLCAVTGGPRYYTGRDMKLTHEGMGITQSDWLLFLQHAGETCRQLELAEQEVREIVNFALSIEPEVVEA